MCSISERKKLCDILKRYVYETDAPYVDRSRLKRNFRMHDERDREYEQYRTSTSVTKARINQLTRFIQKWNKKYDEAYEKLWNSRLKCL